MLADLIERGEREAANLFAIRPESHVDNWAVLPAVAEGVLLAMSK